MGGSGVAHYEWAVRGRPAPGAPHYRVFVVDEAHRFPEVAQALFDGRETPGKEDHYRRSVFQLEFAEDALRALETVADQTSTLDDEIRGLKLQNAVQASQITTLDGKARTLSPEVLVIADRSRCPREDHRDRVLFDADDASRRVVERDTDTDRPC